MGVDMLGKIEKVIIGRRCSDSPFGVHFVFSGEGWGVQGGLGHFNCTFGLEGLKDVCEAAKVYDVSYLEGKPIMVTFDENRTLKEVRILTEVL